jgi:hypothetical protein
MNTHKKPVRLQFVLTLLALCCGAWVAGVTYLPRHQQAAVTWEFGSAQARTQSFEKVPAWDPMSLSIQLPFDAYVYVVSFDHMHGAVTYFPTEYLGTDHLNSTTGRMNFLSAGKHEIPGTWNDTTPKWFVPNVDGSLSLCVIASRAPLADLEELLPLTRQVGNRAYHDQSMGFYMPRAGRDKVIGKTKMPHPVLQAALDSAEAPLDGPMLAWPQREGVYFDTLHIVPTKPQPHVTAPNNPFRKQLQDSIEEKRRDK